MENYSRSAVTEILWPAYLAPTAIISPHSDARFKPLQTILTMSTCLNGLCGCHVMG